MPQAYGQADSLAKAQYLEISISNPVAPGEKRAKSGNQMALANIRQRFELAYGSSATVDVESTESTYAVKLRFPEEIPE